MPDIEVTGLPESFLDPALDRLERVEFAFSHVAKALHLELADIALGSDPLDEETKQKLASLGQSLISMAGTGYELLQGIATQTGVLADELQGAALPLAPRQRHETPTRPTPTGGGRRRLPRGASPARAAERAAAPEATPEPEVGELYKAIVDTSQVPEMQVNGDSIQIEVAIIGDEKVRIGEHELSIKGHDLFLFNALMLLRDKPRAASELRELGFYPGSANGTAQAVFSTSMNNVSTLLNKAAGVELVKKVGGGTSTRYCVNPNLLLVDEREENPSPTAAVTSAVKKN